MCRAICQELAGSTISLKEIEMEPLSQEETRFFLDQRWKHRVSAHSDDFTDQEAVSTILRITRGNIRLIERLMMQVEHVLLANQLTVVTKEVVETARKNLIIGSDQSMVVSVSIKQEGVVSKSFVFGDKQQSLRAASCHQSSFRAKLCDNLTLENRCQCL